MKICTSSTGPFCPDCYPISSREIYNKSATNIAILCTVRGEGYRVPSMKEYECFLCHRTFLWKQSNGGVSQSAEETASNTVQ
jgi:hypothetical protein